MNIRDLPPLEEKDFAMIRERAEVLAENCTNERWRRALIRLADAADSLHAMHKRMSYPADKPE